MSVCGLVVYFCGIVQIILLSEAYSFRNLLTRLDVNLLKVKYPNTRGLKIVFSSFFFRLLMVVCSNCFLASGPIQRLVCSVVSLLYFILHIRRSHC